MVRVERPHHGGGSERIRFCTVMGAESKMVCLGNPAPRPGAVIELVEFQGSYRGQARVVDVGAYSEPGMQCNNDNAHSVDIEMVTLGAQSPSQMVFGLMGFPVDPRSVRMITDMSELKAPGGRSGEYPIFAVDREGDGTADLMVTYFDCTNEVPTNPGASTAGCLEYWRNKLGEGWRMAQRDIFYNCR